MPQFDLHTHSTASDGILSPGELVSRAKQRGVDVLALTDHDTTAGLDAAHSAAGHAGVRLIAGIEVSSQWQGRGVHILGLNVDPAHAAMVAAVEHQSHMRLERAQRIDERLRKVGIEGALAGARALAGEAILVGWIRASGGVAVLAHPCKYKLTRTKLCALAREFCSAGGEGIEVISGNQPLNTTRDLVRIANELGLSGSCGSDFHVPDHPWQELGGCGALPSDCRPVWQAWL
ncbi:MAG: PHP domain-containing protein [Exilibacterium sp.]